MNAGKPHMQRGLQALSASLLICIASLGAAGTGESAWICAAARFSDAATAINGNPIELTDSNLDFMCFPFIAN